MNSRIDLDDVRQSGTYVVAPADLDVLDAAAHDSGLALQRVSLLGCTGKADLLQRVAHAFAFPSTFGGNWDALADCLCDLAWLPAASGHAWLFDHAEDFEAASQTDFDTFCDILGDACADWQSQGTPCFAFLALPADPDA